MTLSHTKFSFDQNIDRQRTGSLKWDRFVDRDVLPMWVADMDFQSPPEVISALHARVKHGVFGYSQPTAELTQLVCEYLQHQHQVDVEKSWIVWLPGCVPALSMACGCVGDVADQVLTCTPVYPPFLEVHRDSKRDLTKVPLATNEQGRYVLDWPALENAVGSSTKVFLFCNPQNPTGRVFTREEVEQVGQFCVEHDLVLCSDEIHCDLILEPHLQHVSALSLSAKVRDRSITLMAASKTYNIAGLACAFAVVPNKALRQQFRRAAGKLLSEISPLSFVATEAAYRFAEPWRQALLNYLRQNRDLLMDRVTNEMPSITITRPEATYLAWLDVRPLRQSCPRSYFEQHGVGLSDGAAFGAEGYLRLNFGCPATQLQAALDRMVIAAGKVNE